MKEIKKSRCIFCNGDLYGKVEGIFYGMYCKKCEKWIYKSQELLKAEDMELDREVYKILLIGAGNEKQIERIAIMADINIYMAGQYLRSEKEILLYEGNAKETYKNAMNMTQQGLLYKIIPEFPYEILRKITEEERSNITNKLMLKI